MLTNELRPTTWDDMAGQKINVQILKSIVRNPDGAPRCIIMEGAFGGGKTTSARILARELNGIKDPNYDLNSSPFYYEYDSTVIGNVEKIRELRDTLGSGIKGYWQVVVLDECIRGDADILLADGSTVKMKDLVDGCMNVEVMSYNSQLGIIEPKRVTGWFENTPKVFYSVGTTLQKGVVKCSDNHVFITPEGEKPLSDLNVGDKIYRYNPVITKEQEQVILGTLLGDSGIDAINTNSSDYEFCPRIVMTQGIEQENWLRLKGKILDNIIGTKDIRWDTSQKKSDKSFAGSKAVGVIATRSLLSLRKYSKLLMVNRKKTVTREYLDMLNPLGIAVWYLDDGSKHTRKYRLKDGSIVEKEGYVHLHTEGFTLEENTVICDYFKDRWNIEFKPYTYGDKTYVHTTKFEETDKFFQLISPYLCDDIISYKNSMVYAPGNGLKHIVDGGMGIVEDIITRIRVINGKLEPSYDIEVDGNHNYFVGGILVHNCHAVSSQAQTALLKILEEVKSNTFFILCSTHIYKILPTIRSRSLELKYSTVPYEEIIEHLDKVAIKLGADIPDDIKGIIASRSGGHMRNAHMLLDKYFLIGSEVFKESVKSSLSLYCRFFNAVLVDNQADVMKSLNELMMLPLEDLKSDLADLIMMVMKAYNGFEVASSDVKALVSAYGNDIMKLVRAYYSDWTKNFFRSDSDFQAGMLCYYVILKGSKPAEVNQGNQQVNSGSAVNDRRMVRR